MVVLYSGRRRSMFLKRGLREFGFEHITFEMPIRLQREILNRQLMIRRLWIRSRDLDWRSKFVSNFKVLDEIT